MNTRPVVSESDCSEEPLWKRKFDRIHLEFQLVDAAVDVVRKTHRIAYHGEDIGTIAQDADGKCSVSIVISGRHWSAFKSDCMEEAESFVREKVAGFSMSMGSNAY